MRHVIFWATGLLFAILVFLFVSSCTNDELPRPEIPEYCDTLTASYLLNVKPIIDASCAYSGCHDGAGGIGPGNYKNYNGIVGVLESGLFRQRVLTQKDDAVVGMPPNSNVYPESEKDDLTEEELRVIECWINAGYPEE